MLDIAQTLRDAINPPRGNRVLPPGSQFSAVVDGKPTGLAGCTQAGGCPRAARCLRADDRLSYRAPMHYPTDAACRAFITKE